MKLPFQGKKPVISVFLTVLALLCLLRTSGQSTINSSSTSFSDYHEQPVSPAMPEGTWRTIQVQNKILKEQGRAVNMHSTFRPVQPRSSSVCGSCRDMGAESGWSVWQAEAGANIETQGLNLTVQAAPTTPRFSITTGTGIDRLTPGVNPGDPPITVVAPPGFGSSSILLGELENDGIGGGCVQPQLRAGCAERLTYCFTVGLLDTNFVYAYAFVMENPGDSTHTLLDMPYVEFMMLDANGDTIDCAMQRYIASESFPGQYKCNDRRLGGVNGGGGGQAFRDTAIYKPWTVEGVNLSNYIGQTLTVVITNADCQLGGHMSHSYWDFNCGSNSAVVKPNCYTNAPDTLIAPTPPDPTLTYTYEWYLNNDPNPVGTTPVITPYAQNGDTFTVKVTSPGGCNWYARYAPQHYTVSADFTFNTQCGFANFSEAAFSPSTEDPINYWSWDFGPAVPATSLQTDPDSIYFPPGNHVVTLIAGTYSPGCRDTIQYVVNVPQIPVAGFSVQDVCLGSSVSFTSSSSVAAGDTISNYSWSFQAGVPATSTQLNPVVNYAAPATNNASLIVTTTRGCRDTIQQQVTIAAQPVAAFSAPSVCIGDSLQLTNQSSINSLIDTLAYSWSIPGSTTPFTTNEDPRVYFPSPDTTEVTLIVVSSFGCSDTSVRDVIVHPLPVASFSAPLVCSGSPVSLTNSSTVVSGDSIISYAWQFPGGQPAASTSIAPTVNYLVPDTFDVQLVVTNEGGCRDTMISPAIVSANPTANFSASSICLGDSLVLVNNSSIFPAGDSIRYNWTISFGTPSSSITTNPVVQFPSYGTSTIMLVASAVAGCTDTLERTITVHPLPSADFSAPLVCFGTPVDFSNLSTAIIGDSIVNNNWTIQNGNPAFSQLTNPVSTFTTLDTSTVQLIVTTINGCRDTVERLIITNPDPFADFSATSLCLNEALTLVNNSVSNPAGNLLSYSWSIEGGTPSTSTDRDPVVEFTIPDSSTISLIVTANGGCTDSVTRTIAVHPLPLPFFTAPTVCFGDSTPFNNTSSAYPGDAISSYDWTLSGAQPASSVQDDPTVLFSAPGIADVQLVATTVNGCRDTVTSTINIYRPPVAAISPGNSGCAPVCHPFADLSTSADGNLTQWNWQFPGGTPATSNDPVPPTVCYDQPGTYDVSLEVISSTGCRSVIDADSVIRVYENPVANFAIASENVTYNNPVFWFNDLSTDNVVQWTWDFGDGSPAETSGPITSHSYASSMTGNDFYNYVTTLTVTTRFGCVDTISRPLDITPNFTFYMPSAFTPNGDGRNNTFYGKGIGITEYELWIFDRWGLQLYYCKEEDSNVPYDIQGQEGLSALCKWDGLLFGRPVQQDVYVWKVRLTDVFGKKHSYLGRVTVYY
jgi:PKD repeat protein